MVSSSLEHVRSERPILGSIMDLLNPVTVNLWGANINRRTLDMISEVKFADVQARNLAGDIVKEIIITNGDLN